MLDRLDPVQDLDQSLLHGIEHRHRLPLAHAPLADRILDRGPELFEASVVVIPISNRLREPDMRLFGGEPGDSFEIGRSARILGGKLAEPLVRQPLQDGAQMIFDAVEAAELRLHVTEPVAELADLGFDPAQPVDVRPPRDILERQRDTLLELIDALLESCERALRAHLRERALDALREIRDAVAEPGALEVRAGGRGLRLRRPLWRSVIWLGLGRRRVARTIRPRRHETRVLRLIGFRQGLRRIEIPRLGRARCRRRANRPTPGAESRAGVCRRLALDTRQAGLDLVERLALHAL